MTEIKVIFDKAELTEIVENAVQKKFTELTNLNKPQRKVRSLRELAKYLKISLSKVQQLKNAGKIPHYQDGRIVIFDLDQVDEAFKGFKKYQRTQIDSTHIHTWNANEPKEPKNCPTKEIKEPEKPGFISPTIKAYYDELLNKKIDDINYNLSARARSILKMADVSTVEDLTKIYVTQLLKVRNFGKKTLKELEAFCDHLGISMLQ